MGLGAMTNVAETSYIQGTHDLYSDPEFKERFIAGYELNAGYVNELLDYMAANNITDTTLFDDNPSSSPRNATIANWKPVNFPCNDFKVGGSSAFLGTEIALNHFSNRLNIAMPNTKKLAERKRPQKGGNHLFYETLTHANTGNAGITPTVIVPPPAPLPDTTMALNGVTQGSLVSSPIRLSAVVANAPNFDRIEFKVDGILINSDRTAPYCLSGDANGACNDYTIAAGTHIVSATLFYDTTKTIAKDVFFTVSQPPVVTPQDTTAPTPPTNITRAFRTDLANFRYVLNLKWTASQDNVGGTGIKEYQIRRNGKLIGINSPTSTSFADTTIGLNISYTYSIIAIDGATPPNASTPGTTTVKASCVLVWCSIK